MKQGISVVEQGQCKHLPTSTTVNTDLQNFIIMLQDRKCHVWLCEYLL